MSKIILESSEDRFKLFDDSSIVDWLVSLLDHHGKRLKSLHYFLTSDEHVLEVNRKYLNHDYYTDIITFNYNKYDFIAGDIYISVERIEDFSRGTNVDFHDEYLRVIAHGCLHLLGFDDKNEEDQKQMRREENKAIELYKKKFHVDVPRETRR